VPERQLPAQSNQLQEKKLMNFHLPKQLKVSVIALIALALALTPGAGFAFTSINAAPDDADEVREVLRQSALGFERGDMAMLNKVWANDEFVTVFEQGHANYGWADYRDNHLAPEMKEMKNTKYSLSDIRVKVTGATAWATFKYSISADIGSRHVDGGGLGTAVLEKRDGRWQIVHWHTSAPRRAPAPTSSPAKKH
jgi:ketosteroid isomerase-like protein